VGVVGGVGVGCGGGGLSVGSLVVGLVGEVMIVVVVVVVVVMRRRCRGVGGVGRWEGVGMVREGRSRVGSVRSTVAEVLLLLMLVVRVGVVGGRASLGSIPVVLVSLLLLLLRMRGRVGREGEEYGTSLRCRRVGMRRTVVVPMVSSVRVVPSVEVRLLRLELRGGADELLRELLLLLISISIRSSSSSPEVPKELLLLSCIEGNIRHEDVSLRRLVEVSGWNEGELMRLRDEGLGGKLREVVVGRVSVSSAVAHRRPSLLELLLLVVVGRPRVGIVG